MITMCTPVLRWLVPLDRDGPQGASATPAATPRLRPPGAYSHPVAVARRRCRPAPPAAAPGRTLRLVANSTSTLKRLLLGRPFRSDRLQHTLLPKRIALPIFASDPLSSVAYAPDEILLTLSLAGAAAYIYAPWVRWPWSS